MRRIVINICLLSAVLFGAVAATRAAETYLAGQLDVFLRTRMANALPAADISWGSIRIRLLNLDVVFQDVFVRAAGGHEIGIERLMLSKPLRWPLNRAEASIRMSGLHVVKISGEVPTVTDSRFPLDLHGLKANLNLDVFYDPVQHRLDIKRLDIRDKHWGQLHLKLVLGHFDPKQLKTFQFAPLLIQTADLTYRDDDLIRQVMAYYLETDPDFVRFMSEAVDLAMETSKELGNPARAASLTGLQHYFEEPGQLRLRMVLLRPVNISEIMNARRVSSLLEMIDYMFTNA